MDLKLSLPQLERARKGQGATAGTPPPHTCPVTPMLTPPPPQSLAAVARSSATRPPPGPVTLSSVEMWLLSWAGSSRGSRERQQLPRRRERVPARGRVRGCKGWHAEGVQRTKGRGDYSYSYTYSCPYSCSYSCSYCHAKGV